MIPDEQNIRHIGFDAKNIKDKNIICFLLEKKNLFVFYVKSKVFEHFCFIFFCFYKVSIMLNKIKE